MKWTDILQKILYHDKENFSDCKDNSSIIYLFENLVKILIIYLLLFTVFVHLQQFIIEFAEIFSLKKYYKVWDTR